MKKQTEQFNNFLQQQNFLKEPKNLYTPIGYMMQLGGKRIRPILCIMGNQLFEPNEQPTLNAALAIEIFHNFTLVHDDIMDEAPIRRGQPTIQHKYGLNTAILSGDLMMIWAYQYLEKVGTQYLLDVFTLFNKTAAQVCDGQQWDMDFEERQDVTIPEYITMIEHKTAVLLAASLKMGAIIGNATKEEAEDLYKFGKNIGIAFQLQDDYLDAYANAEKFGKKVGGDIAQNKKTFLLLKALAKANPTQHTELQKLITTKPTNETEKIQAVLSIYNDLDIKEETRQQMKSYHDKALKALSNIQAPQEKKQPLLDIVDLLMGRDV